MFDLTQIPETLSSLTSGILGAIELGEKIKGLIMIDSAKAAEELSNMHNQLLSVQTATLKMQQLVIELNQRNHQLTEQLKRIDEWEQQKDQYRLIETAPLSYAYIQTSTERPPYFCAACFGKRDLAMLQSSDKVTAIDKRICKILICTNCKQEAYLKTDEPASGHCSRNFRP